MASGGPIYEVSVSVPAAADASYSLYMRQTHIPAILATGRFSRITMCAAQDAALGLAEDPSWVHYKTSYIAVSADALAAYLAQDAPALRADFMAHCPAEARISRRVWGVCEEWAQGGGATTEGGVSPGRSGR